MNNQTIISLIEKFHSLNLSAIIDFDKFNGYAITHNSTSIEGSTLTETETRLLLDEGVTPAGKPLLHSLMVQAHYHALHPFYDGNGRTARLFMNYLQLYFNLPLSIVFKEDKAAYFEALQQTRKEEDITIFRTFMFAQYAKYLQPEIDKFEKLDKTGEKGKGYSFVF